MLSRKKKPATNQRPKLNPKSVVTPVEAATKEEAEKAEKATVKRRLNQHATETLLGPRVYSPGWPQDNTLSRAASACTDERPDEYTWTGDEYSSQGTRKEALVPAEVLIQRRGKTGGGHHYQLTCRGLDGKHYRHDFVAASMDAAKGVASSVVRRLIYHLADNLFLELAQESRCNVSELLYRAAVSLRQSEQYRPFRSPKKGPNYALVDKIAQEVGARAPT